MPQPRAPLGVGFYTRADAAHLLRMRLDRVNRWVRGYSYSWTVAATKRRGRQPPVIKTDLPLLDDALTLSFLELMELRVVKEFLDQRIPLQTVRVAWRHAAQAFQTQHPFAHHRVFLDRGHIFVALRNDPDATPDLMEVSSRKRPFQVIAGPIFEKSVKELEFDERTFLVRRWWPLGLGVPVVLDPHLVFGAPVIQGTRIPTEIIARHLKTRSVEQVAKAFEVDRLSIEAAQHFESRLAHAA